MDKTTIINLLTNSGIKVHGMDSGFIYFEDPSCIYPAFDTILNYAWVFILFLTVFMLGGWALLYIKNGVNINNLFNNAKTIILIFCVLSVVKPIVNIVYGNDLFAKGCDVKQVSLNSVNELLNTRNKLFGKSDNELYETFNVTDSGPKEEITEDDEDDDDDEESSTQKPSGYDAKAHADVVNRYIDTYSSMPEDTDQTTTETATEIDNTEN